jgi:hypothetical protein
MSSLISLTKLNEAVMEEVAEKVGKVAANKYVSPFNATVFLSKYTPALAVPTTLKLATEPDTSSVKDSPDRLNLSSVSK